MIVIDYSNLFTIVGAGLQSHLGSAYNLNSFRQALLFNILKIRTQFSPKEHEIVICKDTYTSKYWRKEFFPYYKASRKKREGTSSIDFTLLRNHAELITAELNDYVPLQQLVVDKCEGDDLIASLAKYNSASGNSNKFIIVSNDKDFDQLPLHYTNLIFESYTVNNGELNKKDISEYDLTKHILSGDSSDGIPNIFSHDSFFADKDAGIVTERQKSITKKVLNEFNESSLDESIRANYLRNKKLIDFSEIPSEIYENIIKQYSENKSKKMTNRIEEYCNMYDMEACLELYHAYVGGLKGK